MEILLNGDKEILDKEYTVYEILQKYEFNPDIVMVNLNGDILNRGDFESTTIKKGDTLDILMYMGGGQ